MGCRGLNPRRWQSRRGRRDTTRFSTMKSKISVLEKKKKDSIGRGREILLGKSKGVRNRKKVGRDHARGGKEGEKSRSIGKKNSRKLSGNKRLL